MEDTLDQLSKEDIISIFEAIPLEVLLFLRDNLSSLERKKAHGRLEISVKDGYPSTLHCTNSTTVKRYKPASRRAS